MLHTNSKPIALDTNDASVPPDVARWVSAMVDGELPSEEFSQAWSQCLDSPVADEAWHMQHLIGEALRNELGTSSSLDLPTAQAYAQRVVQMAHSTAGVADLMEDAGPVATESVHRVAANDSVFRWKVVAGLASLSAVLSVTWGVWSGIGAEASLAVANAPVSPPRAVSVATEVTPSTVLVATERGVMERDARLDALIHAHRQHGGGTALQVPAGFMRAATHAPASQP